MKKSYLIFVVLLFVFPILNGCINTTREVPIEEILREIVYDEIHSYFSTGGFYDTTFVDPIPSIPPFSYGDADSVTIKSTTYSCLIRVYQRKVNTGLETSISIIGKGIIVTETKTFFYACGHSNTSPTLWYSGQVDVDTLGI